MLACCPSGPTGAADMHRAAHTSGATGSFREQTPGRHISLNAAHPMTAVMMCEDAVHCNTSTARSARQKP